VLCRPSIPKWWRAIGRSVVLIVEEEEQRGETRAAYGKGLVKELSTRLSAEFGRGFDKSSLWNMRVCFSVFLKSTRCVENCPGPIIGCSFGWKNRRLALFTRLKRSIPAGRLANLSDRSIRSYSNGWPFRAIRQVSWRLPKRGTRGQ